jgi:hypothetical protein
MKFWYLSISRKPDEKIQNSFQSDKNKGYFILRSKHIFITRRYILLRMRNFSEKEICGENEKIKKEMRGGF